MERLKEAVSSIPLAAHSSDALLTRGSQGVVRALPMCSSGGFS